MRIVRFVHGDDAPSYGVVQGDPGEEWIAAVAGDPLYTEVSGTGERYELDDVRLVSPVLPRSKVIAVGRNYADHAKELGNEVPSHPGLFLIPNTSVAGPDDPVVIPPFVQEVSYEAELAVVIGTMCKNVPADQAMSVIFGYTGANDVTARDLQKSDLQWARAKGMDTFTPIGPWIETDLDPADLRIVSRVDGEVRQDGRTSDMIFDIPTLIEHISAAFTLLPGDVILTGTPKGVGKISAGQRAEVEIQGIGSFSNPFLRRE